MGCPKITYRYQQEVINVPPLFVIGPLEKKEGRAETYVKNTPYRFNAKEVDPETGNYYYGARYYNPMTSVWLSVDPLAHKYPSLSPYAFVGNNPVMLIDPDGRDFINVHKLLKEKAKGVMEAAKVKLDAAAQNFAKFDGTTKESRKENGTQRDYRRAKRNHSKAEREYNRRQSDYNQQVQYEAVVDNVLADLKENNPDIYNDFNKLRPSGSDGPVMNIPVRVKKGSIAMKDANGFPTGQRTVEAIKLSHLSNGMVIRASIEISLSMDPESSEGLAFMRGMFIHALGHIDKGIYREEEYAVDFTVKHTNK